VGGTAVLDRHGNDAWKTVIVAACLAHERVAADLMSHPRHGMLYPEYRQRADELRALHVKRTEATRALQAYRIRARMGLEIG
jgi:hypothetical protein